MTKVLVTGASGFLAQHIIPLLQEWGYFVIGVDKRPLQKAQPDKFIQEDVSNLGFRDLMGVDYVIHLAWRTNIPDCMRHPVQSTKDNVDMSMHLLEFCKEAGVRKFLFPSTASLYGNNVPPWAENLSPRPSEPYSLQKLTIEYACQMYSESFELPTVVFRFFQVFGEYQREDTALAAFIKAKREGRPITLTETTAQSSFKSGQRDFIYAGDLAKAVILAMESDKTGKGEIFNVASGKIHTMEEIAEALQAEVKWIPRRPYEVECHWGDITKLKALGWQPEVDVIDWLKKGNYAPL